MTENDFFPTFRLRWRATDAQERWENKSAPDLRGKDGQCYVLEQWWQGSQPDVGEWRKLDVV